jgi:hypothetical protein
MIVVCYPYLDIFTSEPSMEIEPHRHRLYSLWEDFLQKMDHPDHCARLLDSFIDIVFQAKNVDWRRNLEDSDEIDNYRKQMAKIIRIRAPNIVILDIRGHADILHPTIGSGSIVVPQCWADRWDRAMDFEPDSRLALALEAYLKVVIVHQLAHWLSASEGPHTLLESFHSLSLDDTAKSLGFARGMDPGYYVEMVGGGGIVSFDEDRDDSASICLSVS